MTTQVATPTLSTSTLPSTSPSPSSSPSPSLQYAAKNGLFVKLHVKDGCGKAVDIPVKNLLRVNAKAERLSNEASYSILRHCALSQLFRFEPNQQIPTYAWRNFLTRFSYESSPLTQAHGQIVKYNITNNAELTEALEVAASVHLIELDEYESEFDLDLDLVTNVDVAKGEITSISRSKKVEKNVIILDIHCEFINRRNVNMHRQRKDATKAAEHVVKTLREWIQKASAFVVDIVGDLEHRDYVVVRSSSVASDKGASVKKALGVEEEKDGKGKGSHQHQPMEWARRFIQVLLLPETKDAPVMVEHYHCSPPCKGFSNSKLIHMSPPCKGFSNKARGGQSYQPNLLDEYEESLEVLTASFVQGLKKTSKFLHRVMKEHQEKTRKNNRRIRSNMNDEDNLSLSASPTPSIVKSVASISSSSSSSSIDEVVVEQGIEIVFDPNNENQNQTVGGNSNDGDKEEWKIFFGESKEEKEEEEVVMISNPCEDEVLSLASSGVEDSSSSSSTTSSFEQVSEAKAEEIDDDDVSWAMLSDDE